MPVNKKSKPILVYKAFLTKSFRRHFFEKFLCYIHKFKCPVLTSESTSDRKGI